MLISFIVVIISQGIHIPKCHIVHCKYMHSHCQFYISKPKKKIFKEIKMHSIVLKAEERDH